MTNSLKNRLLGLLGQEEIAEVFSLLISYFEGSRSNQNRLRENVLELQQKFIQLKHQLSTGDIEQASFDNQLMSIREELARSIEIVEEDQKIGAKPPTSKKNKSSIFDRISNKIEDLRDDFFPSKGATTASEPKRRMRPTAKPPKSTRPKPPSSERMEEPLSPPLPPIIIKPRIPPNPAPVPAPVVKPSPKPSKTQAGGTSSPFQKGKILYAIPRAMCLNKVSRCKVRIAPEHISQEELLGGLTEKEKNNAQNESIRITQVMKVELLEATDLDNFDILARNSMEQPVLPFGYTEWGFDVSPKRPGHQALMLRVTAKINLEGYGERSFDVAVLDRAILVSTTDEPMVEIDFEEQSIPDPEWTESDEQAVIYALKEGNIGQAIERIANFVQDKDRNFHKELILHHSRWNDNSNQLMHQLITAADWDIVNNKVRFALMQLLEMLKESFPSGSSGKVMDWQSATDSINGAA